MSNIKVSVVMLAYNHGKYIEKALRSVAEQITNFEFEVIIGDDASPDNTQELIKKVYQEYPNIIKPVLRDRNLGIMKNAIDLIKRCQGKYIAILEGDDFWISSDKLQKQVDFLESNQEYVAYYHKNSIVDDESNIVCEKDTEFCDHTEYTIDDFSQFLLPGQSGTVIMRKYILDKVLSDKNTLSILKHIKFTPADRILALYLISIGKVYCGDEVMSAYRSVIKKGGTNWRSKYGSYDRKTSIYFVKMSREIEKISNMIGYPVIIETEEKKAFDLALWKILNCDIGYYFNVIYLLLTSRRRREFIKMLREQEKQAFELACWRILNGKKKFYFNIVLLFLFGKKRKKFFSEYKETKKKLKENKRYNRKEKCGKLRQKLSSIKWEIINSFKSKRQ